jgi:acetyl-CoA acetyltransferase
MPTYPLHNVAIAGVYNTRQDRGISDLTSQELTLDAIRGVLADADLSPADVDGVNCRAGTGGGEMDIASFVHQLGANPCWTGSAGTGILAILEAAAAIAAGYCHTVLIATGQSGAYHDRSATAPWTRPENEFTQTFGMFTAAQFALVARRHMHLYGTRPEHLAEVAATIRNHGHVNPEAVYYGRGPFSRGDILNSRMIADPFHLLDCAATSEGGAGVLLTTAERARDLRRPPAYILGGAEERRGKSYVQSPTWERVGTLGREAARKTFAMAGLTPGDVDACILYDPFSFEIIRQFEAFGFCGEGEGGPFVMDDRIGLGGQYPICTDGGLMSFSHPGAGQHAQRVIEAVKQLRGACGDRQVPSASVALATSAGSAAFYMATILLGREQP